MSENMKLWDSVCITDPGAVKKITGKQYQGNSPKPFWIIQRATETFGPCGIGWGVEVVNERFERFGDTESLHVAMVRVWYMHDGKRGQIEQMGQTRASYMTGAGKFLVDEDAPKKSVTDGMVKCLSMIGFAGDIFSGQWDDSKYVQWAGEETRRRESGEAQPEPDKQDDLQLLVKKIRTAVSKGGKSVEKAAAHLATLAQPELDALWGQLTDDEQAKLIAAWPAA